VKNKPSPSKEPKFEESLDRLEKIVREMESGDLALEDILKKYEEGNHLVKLCSARLNEAEQRIEILMKDKGGNLAIKPLEVFEEDEDELDASEETSEDQPRNQNRQHSKPSEEGKDLF
jgi:exodeoxyribonuclease VII small subunit